jgi:hypothetical protein
MRPYALLGLLVAPAACSTVEVNGPVPPPIELAHPPPDPGGPPPTSDDVAVFAIRHLWVGDLDPATGQQSSTAWSTLGFDIDGRVTTLHSTDVCQLAPGASHNTQIDGVGGIDNSFGASIVPVFEATLLSNNKPFGQDLQDSISAGQVTDLIVVRGLGGGPTVSPLAASLAVAAPLGKTPTFTVDDVWPLDPSSVREADAAAPLIAFSHAYVTGDVFVAEPPSGSGEIALGYWDSRLLVFPVRHVQIAMTLSADGTSATSGTISGVLPADRLVEALRLLTGSISSSLCSGGAFDSVAGQFEQAADILLDGTNDPSQPCDAVSIGLGFDAVRVQAGPVADILPQPDPCAEAGL